MSVVVLAYHEMGCMGLRTLLSRGVDVSAVFTYEDDPDENCWFGSVAELARSAGLPTHTTEKINDPEWVERVRELAPDLILSFYYRHMVGKKLREIPRYGAINLHGSLLPKYRGRSPINWTLVNGETRAGLTLHHMVRRADAGDIIDQEGVEVGPDDTAFDLYQKLLPAGERLIERQLEALLAGTAPRQVQNEDEATLFGGRGPEDGRIDWRWPAKRIHDLVRAVAEPWPGAFCDTPEGRVKVWRTRRCGATEPALSAGELQRGQDGFLRIGTGEGALELLKVEPAAGVPVETGKSWLSQTRSETQPEDSV